MGGWPRVRRSAVRGANARCEPRDPLNVEGRLPAATGSADPRSDGAAIGY